MKFRYCEIRVQIQWECTSRAGCVECFAVLLRGVFGLSGLGIQFGEHPVGGCIVEDILDFRVLASSAFACEIAGFAERTDPVRGSANSAVRLAQGYQECSQPILIELSVAGSGHGFSLSRYYLLLDANTLLRRDVQAGSA
jgi:hypothetical protein